MRLLERVSQWSVVKPRRADILAILALTILWAVYFWRVLTPDLTNQWSYPLGDFSGQFVAFGAYQARRLLAGEIPLWNPYSYAGHPFIADTQAAVFYPPRLITIFISHFTGGWSYAALQAEAIAHYWLGTLWMYLFVRTITRSRIAGLVSAITLGYSGYLTGYPPLQLAVLEAGIWLPVGLLGVFKASEGSSYAEQPPFWRISWLALSALALGISLLAGHPQTTLFFSYVLLAYMIHRAVQKHIRWMPTMLALMATFGTGYGLAAVQVLPGLEYARLTIRAGYGFDTLAGGFPFQDLVVFFIPNVVTEWSPLYSGIAALALAGIAVWRKEQSARFWVLIVFFALGLSFGGATILYRLAYLLAPGFSWFRGQERAAYVVAHGVAILAGLGIAALQREAVDRRRLSRVLGIAAIAAWIFAVEVFIVNHFCANRSDIDPLLGGATFLGILATLTWIVLGRLAENVSKPWGGIAILALITFDTFSLTWRTNWQPIPASQRVMYDEQLVTVVQADQDLFRIDGRLGLGFGNNSAIVGLQDIRGVSPLRLATLESYVTHLPDYRLFQLLNVKYVFSDWYELEIPSTIIASSEWSGVKVNLHQIADPTPRAWMAYQVMITPDTGQALGWLSDPSFNPRTTAILAEPPNLDLPSEIPQDWQVTVVEYRPERIVLNVETPNDGILVLSELDYPGWKVTVNAERKDIWQADAGLRALPLKAGRYEIEFAYRPASVRIGAVISGITAVTILAGIASGLMARRP